MAERQSNLTELPDWRTPPQQMVCAPGIVDVWRVSLDVSDGAVSSLAETLDEVELQRAERFRIESKRIEFTITRGCLRSILAQLLSADLGTTVSPSDVTFEYQPHGKPMLAKKWRASGIDFNATHSHGLALIAATRRARLGVDIERLRENRDVEALATRWFSSVEVEQLNTLPADQRAHAFFLGWTRKEAFVKAIGDGITYGLDQFDVALSPAEPPTLLSIQGQREAAASWGMCHLAPADSHVAAVAVESTGFELRTWSMLV